MQKLLQQVSNANNQDIQRRNEYPLMLNFDDFYEVTFIT